jgi:hypothetical protein
MKKIKNIFVLLLVSTIFTVNAQEKLKGNKEITTENRNISDFTKVEVIDNVEVLLVYNEKQSVNVETDSNLQDAVITEVTNETLVIKFSDKIVRTKQMTVHLNVNKHLKELYSYNKAKIKSNNVLIIDSLTINAFDNSEIDLKLNSKNLYVNGKKTVNIKLEVLSNNTAITLEESGKLKATVNTQNSIITVLDRARVDVNGTSGTTTIESNGNSVFEGREFKSKIATTKSNNASKIYVNASETIDISAFNSSEVYLYSNPKITISQFLDKATLFKKDSTKSFF